MGALRVACKAENVAGPGDQLLLRARTPEGFNARVGAKGKRAVAAGPVLAAGNRG